jgi:hypothetical protein
MNQPWATAQAATVAVAGGLPPRRPQGVVNGGRFPGRWRPPGEPPRAAVAGDNSVPAAVSHLLNLSLPGEGPLLLLLHEYSL